MKPIDAYIHRKALAVCETNARAAQERMDASATAGVAYIPRHRTPTECATCKDAGWLRIDVAVGHPSFGSLAPCPDCGEADRSQAQKRRRDAAIPIEMQSLVLATFRAYTPFLVEVYDCVTAFATKPTDFLYLWGAPGTGKTHLAVGAAMQAIMAGNTTRFFRMVDLARAFREASMGGDPGMLGSLLRQIENVDLLVLDDFPPEHMTPFLYEQMYAVLDYRYSKGAATIITSNVPVESLDMPRLASRLSDNRRSEVVAMDCLDYRQIEDRAGLSARPDQA
jgi:DNA replication protein DnaC